MKYKIITFGCQFNISDAERVAAVLEKIGYQKTFTETEADLIMVLACSVRQSAVDRIYGLKQKFEKIKKIKPLVTILSGCVLPSDLPKMKFFDLIFNIKDLPKLPKKLTNLSTCQLINLPTYQLANYFKIHPCYQSSFQAYVPIMTGCNNFCSYCVVPYVRGREVPRPASAVIKECQNLIKKGYKEIILIGQNVNSYKSGIRYHKLGKVINFPKLLKMVDKTPGDYWLSFATSHPKDMSDELIKVMAKSKHIISYLHLPVQSGDNKILKAMNRHYTAAHYKNLIKKVREAIFDVVISTDVIVGFPSETKKQFANTAKLFREVKFDMAYIAPYSPRAGTAAAKLKDNVPRVEKKKREKILTNVLKKTALENNKKLIGQIVEVLVDRYKNSFCFGQTNSFKNIKFASETNLVGQVVLVRVVDCYAWGLRGELPKIVVVLGTTASGKTKLAIKLAKKFEGEIISADSRQVYQGMDIGTGKDLADYGNVPHHLIDIILPKEQFTVADWQKRAYEAIDDILKRGKLPIVCGGTGLYISALAEGYNFLQDTSYPHKEDHPKGDKLQVVRTQLNKLTLKQLLSRLEKIDPETYKVIDRENRRRVQRALEIYYQTGQPKSTQLRKQTPPYQFLQLGLTFPKPILHQRIEQRLKHRLEKEGMIDEVKRLHHQGVSWKRLEEFGLEYRWIAKYLQGKISYQEMSEQLKKAINNFSKRQMTWFRRGKQIRWVRDYEQAERLSKRFLK